MGDTYVGLTDVAVTEISMATLSTTEKLQVLKKITELNQHQ